MHLSIRSAGRPMTNRSYIPSTSQWESELCGCMKHRQRDRKTSRAEVIPRGRLMGIGLRSSFAHLLFETARTLEYEFPRAGRNSFSRQMANLAFSGPQIRASLPTSVLPVHRKETHLNRCVRCSDFASGASKIMRNTRVLTFLMATSCGSTGCGDLRSPSHSSQAAVGPPRSLSIQRVLWPILLFPDLRLGNLPNLGYIDPFLTDAQFCTSHATCESEIRVGRIAL
jgi:hypothetical protein